MEGLASHIVLVKKTSAIPNLSHHTKLCTEGAVCCLHGTAWLSQQVKCTPKLGTGHPKQWQQETLFSSVLRCLQRPFLWGNSGMVCQAAVLDVPTFKCKNHSWISSLKHTLISDRGYRGRKVKSSARTLLTVRQLQSLLTFSYHQKNLCSSSKDPAFHCLYCLPFALMPTNICSK